MPLSPKEKLALRDQNDEPAMRAREVIALEEIADCLKEIKESVRSLSIISAQRR